VANINSYAGPQQTWSDEPHASQWEHKPRRTYGAYALAAAGMNGIAGIFFSLGFTAIFFAMASREEYNSMLANIAALVAVLAFVLSIIGFASTEFGELMTQLVGVTYIVHTIYAVYIGRGLLTRE